MATDVDADDSVSYHLEDTLGLFEIDSDTGVVTLAGQLDYESATSHTITVVASSSDWSESEADYTITVENNPLDDYSASVIYHDMTARALIHNDVLTGEQTQLHNTAYSFIQDGSVVSSSLQTVELSGGTTAVVFKEYNWDANAGSDVASYKVMGVDSSSGSVTSAASQLYVPVNPDNESIHSIQPLDDNSFLVLGRRYDDITFDSDIFYASYDLDTQQYTPLGTMDSQAIGQMDMDMYPIEQLLQINEGDTHGIYYDSGSSSIKHRDLVSGDEQVIYSGLIIQIQTH